MAPRIVSCDRAPRLQTVVLEHPVAEGRSYLCPRGWRAHA